MLHRSIERDMKTVSSALEYAYKVNKEANAQALEQATAAAASSTRGTRGRRPRRWSPPKSSGAQVPRLP